MALRLEKICCSEGEQGRSTLQILDHLICDGSVFLHSGTFFALPLELCFESHHFFEHDFWVGSNQCISATLLGLWPPLGILR
jgi:hypothetical protein